MQACGTGKQRERYIFPKPMNFLSALFLPPPPFMTQKNNFKRIPFKNFGNFLIFFQAEEFFTIFSKFFESSKIFSDFFQKFFLNLSGIFLKFFRALEIF